MKCTVWGDIVSNYVVSLYGDKTHRGDHLEKYRNIESLCCVTGTNIGQLYFKNKQTHGKRDQICDYQRWEWWWEWGEGELDKGSQKI